MPPMSSKNPVVAIVCSDLHLSATPPLARSREDDWFKAMRKPLRQLRDLVHKHEVPLFVAGDLFDVWNPPPRLINFALEEIPRCYAIPGQHDLPYHSTELLQQTAYWTMVLAGVVSDISDKRLTIDGGKVTFYGFPWGRTPRPPHPKDRGISVALCHRYVWTTGHSHPAADASDKASNLRGILNGFDVAFFGDNHSSFSALAGKTKIVNCGGFMRRKSDEADYLPRAHLLYRDGSTVPIAIDTSGEAIYKRTSEIKSTLGEIGDFLQEMEKLRGDPLDFNETLSRYIQSNRSRLSTEAYQILERLLSEQET